MNHGSQAVATGVGKVEFRGGELLISTAAGLQKPPGRAEMIFPGCLDTARMKTGINARIVCP